MKVVPEAIEEIKAPYARSGYQLGKRVFDAVLSFIAITLLLPFFLIIAVVILFTDGFPVIFRQNRLGQGGRQFTIYKFRSMVKNADEVLKRDPVLWAEFQKTYKLTNDPRIMPIGKLLRKTSLDELPQLFNVLKGDMTLVGPRPIVPPEIEKYGDHQDIYLAMKPGCAGLWQCSGRSDTTYEERVAMDKEYYENASLGYDLSILIRTVGAILFGKGAH